MIRIKSFSFLTDLEDTREARSEKLGLLNNDDDKLYTSHSANTIMAKVTTHFQRTKIITSSTDKHYSLDSKDGFRSGC